MLLKKQIFKISGSLQEALDKFLSRPELAAYSRPEAVQYSPFSRAMKMQKKQQPNFPKSLNNKDWYEFYEWF